MTAEWMQDAACAEVDPELFHPAPGANATTIRDAKEICKGCLARTDCLQYALDNDLRDGIYGATTPHDRARTRRNRRRRRVA